MAVTRGRNWLRLAATDDAVTGVLHISTIVCNNTQAAIADFAIEDGAGVVFQNVTVPADDVRSIRVDTSIDGIDAGTMPTNGVITVYTR